jgi:hypothetical protein
VSTIFGSGGGQTKAQQNLTGAETNIVNYGMNQAKSTIPTATSGLDSALSFFQALMSGNKEAITSTLGPSINSLTSQYATAKRVNNEFNPRGGGATAGNEEAQWSEAGQIQNLVSGAQTTGASGVASISEMLAQLGLGELGQASTTAANTDAQLQASLQNQQAQQTQLGSAAGSFLALLTAA